MTNRMLRLALLGLFLPAAAIGEPLSVVTTLPDLADLARQVGGDAVSVTALVKGPQDAHFVEPRPSFVRKLHRADLFVQNGLELELGWAPALLRSARNPDLLPGGPGHLDASTAIRALEVPTGALDRSMGDVHALGNPHYLADPLNGLRVAGALRDRLSALRPEAAGDFARRHADFAQRLMTALVGDSLAKQHAPEVLAGWIERGQLDVELEAGSGSDSLGGWLGLLRGARGTPVVQDHRLWPYFAHRFGLEIVMELEPKPGIAPTTSHLERVIEAVRERDVRLVLASPYFDARFARRVAERTGCRVVPLAHQVGALPGTDDYLSTIGHNVRAVGEAL